MDTETILARSRLYDLLARLVLDGPIGEVRERALEIPPLAEVLPNEDDEAAGARHYQILAMEILPWAGVVLDPDARLGGPVADEAAEWIAAVGLPVPLGVEADHIGVLLRGLAVSEAVQAVGAPTDPSWGLDTLIQALPPLVAALRAQGDPFYTMVLELALELVASHRAEHGPAREGIPTIPGDPLDEPSTGLSDVAAFLVVPAKSGLLVTRSAIDRWAHGAGVPRGFGSRKDTLETLLLGAADHGALASVLDGIASDLADADVTYATYAPLGVPTARWRVRIIATTAMIKRLRNALRSGGS